MDSPDSYTFSDIDVYVNGTKKQTVKPSTRALSTADAAFAYVTFNITNGSATILFKPSTSSATFRNVTLNGFGLNVANTAAQATNPLPADLDYHANSESGKVTLSWTKANSAQKHRVYLGTDSLSVLNATESSAEYKGE